MTTIAIVGSSHCGEAAAYEQVKALIESYPEDTVVISGGAKGVDTTARLVAKELGYEFREYMPTKQSWPEFKKRNLLIAKEADKVYSFVDPLRNKPCYHCAKAQKDNQHQVTGGCYTGLHNGNYEVVEIKECE